MTEKLRSSLIDELTCRLYQQDKNTLVQHWLDLQQERATSINAAREIIRSMNLVPPFSYCRVAIIPGKVDFDFGRREMLGLASALYAGIVYRAIVYSDSGQIVIAQQGRPILKPPFLQKERGHFIINKDEAGRLSPEDPPVKLYEQTNRVLEREGLICAEDNLFLLGLLCNEQTIDPQLLKMLGLLAS